MLWHFHSAYAAVYLARRLHATQFQKARIDRVNRGDEAAFYVLAREIFLASARAGNRRFRLLSALRAHTKVPYKIEFHRETLRALNRPKAAQTGARNPAVSQKTPAARSYRCKTGDLRTEQGEP